MIHLEALHQADLEARRASNGTLEGLRPLARESARRAALAAENEFITARLSYWNAVLNNKPAQ